jgi:hypothetical protein
MTVASATFKYLFKRTENFTGLPELPVPAGDLVPAKLPGLPDEA